MLRSARSVVGLSVTALTPLAVGDLAQRYDDSNKVLYAKQQLFKWRNTDENAKTGENGGSKQPGAAAWLSCAPPKFPYLLSISAGDNPAVVANTLLEGTKVLGSYEEQAHDTLMKLTTPISALDVGVHEIATRYSAIKTAIYGKVSAAFGLHVGVKDGAEDVMMDALLDALRDLQHCELMSADESETDASVHTQTSQETTLPVFVIKDFDTLVDLDAERWLRWTHQVSSEGLAHVVLLTTATLTPSKVQWLQMRHQNGQNATAFDGIPDFICILLRPANGLVDTTSAEEKLHELAKMHNLRLFPELSPASGDCQGDSDMMDDSSSAEIQVIVKATGNWWSDIDVVCQRLKQANLNAVTVAAERLATTHKVCDDFVQEAENGLLRVLHLDGNLQLPRQFTASGISDASDVADMSKVLSTLEIWKCLETLAHVVPVIGGSSLVGSPQQLVDQKSKIPVNCVSPVDALLPFSYRKEGEQKFLDLIDHQVLFLRPKDAVEIGVIPCKTAALVSPCWIQSRPVIKKAFENIHRSDTYFNAILDLDRFAVKFEMLNEIKQYEQEIAERRKSLLDMRRNFSMLQFSMTPAEKAQRKAELALIDVELQAKDAYLEKLRSLLTS